ncbi:MAG: outer membrane beta-barrel protein [Bacteroidota bacterium]
MKAFTSLPILSKRKSGPAKLFNSLLFIFLCTSAGLHAQASISGQVVAGEESAEFVNIVLLRQADSSIFKLELADEAGAFEFTDLEAGDYFIRTTGIGFADTEQPGFSLGENQALDLGIIDIEATAADLNTVEVTARRPMLEQRAGKLVLNVDQMITGTGGTVTDLLRKVPGVIVRGNNISMAGRQGVTILIDMRPTKYMDIASLLREMPADNIAKIEVISQPGAAFDAEGSGGIINIVLKKNLLLGTNGSVYAQYGYGERAKYRTGVNLTHRAGPLNLSGGISLNRHSWVEELDLDRVVGEDDYVQRNEDFGIPRSISLRFGADYDFNDNNRVGINARVGVGDSPRSADNMTEIFNRGSGELVSAFRTTAERDRNWRNVNTDAFYRLKLDTMGQELNFDASYNTFYRRSEIDLRTIGGDFPDRLNSEPADVSIFSTQVDYKLPMGEVLNFSAGAKYSVVEVENELLSEIFVNNVWEVDPNLSNEFDYDESITAGYVNMLYSKNNIEFNVGLRYEHTETLGNNRTIDSLNRRDYSNLFPSVNFSMPVAGPLGLSLAYSYRIERPSYYDLNPFISYLDPVTFQVGNPFLQPEYVHSAQMSLTFEKQPFFNLLYDRTTDVMTQVTEQNSATGEAFQTSVNLNNYTRYGGSLFFPLDWMGKNISGYGGGMLYFHDYESEYLGGEFQQDQWSFTGFLQVNYNLPDDWKMEVTGWYQGAGLEGIIRTNPLYGVSLGLEKTFLDDRLSLQFEADGIVQKFFTGTIQYQDQDFNIESRWEAPVFYVRASYKFGNQYLKGRERRNSASSSERNRLNDN